MQESSQSVNSIPPRNQRLRNISMPGKSVLSITNRPIQEIETNGQPFQSNTLQEEIRESLNVKVIENENFNLFKREFGVNHLIKAYNQKKKKKLEMCMNLLGLDIIKIQCISPEQKYRGKARSSTKCLVQKFPLKANNLGPIKNKSAKLARNHNLNQPDNGRECKSNLLDMIKQEAKMQEDELLCQSSPQKSKFGKTIKADKYLYKRLEGTEKNVKEELGQVYEKRIKSYLQLLWKNQFAHNIYINLDLRHDQINNRPKRLKAYIAPGNNGAMVRGLIKRRFWWVLVDERTTDCQLVWTQTKVRDILDRQICSPVRKPKYLREQQMKIVNLYEGRQSKLVRPVKLREICVDQNYNSKLMHEEDEECYRRYRQRYEGGEKERDYKFKQEKIGKQLTLLENESQNYIIHNHLMNNFYLGNKKALFYNMREYYELLKQNVYDYLPLTFHIRKGIKDPEYTKFVQYFQKRAKLIKSEQKAQEQGEGKLKTRNIWIVKPGENSNQGRGITVIDELYELNNILKQSERMAKTIGTDATQVSQNQNENEKTFIVQMYIDRPMLYNNRKFDIRHYMLISNFYGITRAYWYEEGYIRTSSYEFNIHNFDPQIHLTNDAVQKKYPDYHRYEPYNKVSYEEFQRYLDATYNHKKYNFKKDILPKMKKMGMDAARSVFTKIAPQNQMNNFEIFGLDFMIDRHFKPWLIEINTNPCLECACPLLDRIIPYMVQQSFKLTLDLEHPPPTHYPNTSKHFAPLISLPAFKYSLIFDSQRDGDLLRSLYRRVRGSLMEKIGEIEEDEEYRDEGKQIKLDDYT